MAKHSEYWEKVYVQGRGRPFGGIMPEGFYSMWETCNNCYRLTVFDIPKGRNAMEYINNQPCSHCGCLMKKWVIASES